MSHKHTLTEEFTQHFPYTLMGTFIAMGVVWWFSQGFIVSGDIEKFHQKSDSLFHLLHPLHVCMSAIATTALSLKYLSKFKAIIMGILGTAIPCGLSDYFFPYIGGKILGQSMHLHVCILEDPQLFFPFLVIGILGGLWAEEKLTHSHLLSHGAHVFISSGASLLYCMSFGFTIWLKDVRYVFPAFLIIVLAVWIPCCLSDIALPVATHKHTKE